MILVITVQHSPQTASSAIKLIGSWSDEAWFLLWLQWSFVSYLETNNCGKIVSDFEHVISHHIQHDDFMAALEVLIKQVRTMFFWLPVGNIKVFILVQTRYSHCVKLQCISLGEENRPFSLPAQFFSHVRHLQKYNKTGAGLIFPFESFLGTILLLLLFVK